MTIKASTDIKFDSNGLVPAIAQDSETLRVLMLAYMNREALDKTLSTGKAHYYSRSRKSLWLKGETSGNFQMVEGVYYDCDADTILIMVKPMGPSCHTGEASCFYRSMKETGAKTSTGASALNELFKTIKERRSADPSKSYVASLYAKGLPKILEKVEEESGEFAEAAREKGKKDVIYEFSDLLFHSLVLLANEGIEMEEVYAELKRRFGTSGHAEKAARKGNKKE